VLFPVSFCEEGGKKQVLSDADESPPSKSRGVNSASLRCQRGKMSSSQGPFSVGAYEIFDSN